MTKSEMKKAALLAVEKDTLDDKVAHEICQRVAKVLAKHEGKKFTKRLLKPLTEEFSEFTVWISRPYSFSNQKLYLRSKDAKTCYPDHKIEIPEGEIRVGNVGDYRQGIKGTFWAENCPYAEAALERIEKNNEILKSGKLDLLIEMSWKIKQLQESIEALELGSYEFPARYAVNKVLEGKE